MGDYDEEIERQAAKRLEPHENQHVRLRLELAHSRNRFWRTVRIWATWLVSAATAGIGLIQFLDKIRGN